MTASRVAAVLLVTLGLPVGVGRAREDVAVVKKPATDTANAFYVSNRAPLLPNLLIKLPPGSIRPGGWLRKQLELHSFVPR